ncbi:FxSxx-COOH system tetratricopeptide repeat protein [Kitasatospora sp. NBC_00240]|uniref:FxSxx-COOH system tetratricopeptide repeat protein n=1 Tax=Kitasatospora sp. NBC_00240 TaxID=2903567 RepID=UPI00225BA1CC|nr:FxSxx-COOH system tetratricopeptide repeat protein [Kitasatospora sp. NBC_00240]MCX5211262.1 FxSxx-COOH system tetratricopeptide repeat protein [Kitasatospora sp. NBC_00240]
MTAEPVALPTAEPATLSASGTGSVATFYSYKGGTGRTMALANVGWILASQGMRVLLVDWDLEAPGLHRYFHPLLIDPELHATDGLIDLLRAYVGQALPGPDDAPALGPRRWLAETGRLDSYVCGLALDLPAGGRLDLMPAGRQNAAYSAAVTSFNWRSFYNRSDIRGAEFLYALREQWTRSYDYVLIDSRTGVSDTSGICTVLMPDTVVDCFTLGAQSIRGGVDAARAIVNAEERDIRVLPVPMRVEGSERAGLQAGRDLAHDSFAPYLDRWLSPDRRGEYWRDVEVPYRPFYAYEEIPATVVERPQQGYGLLGAFERLAAWLTDGRVRALDPVPERARHRLYAAYLRTDRSRSRQVYVSYAPGERVWAEWAAAELAGFGYLASLHSAAEPLDDAVPSDAVPSDADVQEADVPEAAGPAAGDGRVLALLSPEYSALPRAGELWRRLPPAGHDGGPERLLALRIGPAAGRPAAPFAGRDVPDLIRTSAEEARSQLFELLGPAPGAGRWLDGADEPAPDPVRFPGYRPSVQGIPPRNAAFTGRDRILEVLRDRFDAGPAAVPVQVLHGLGGVGKSQTAAEYAHRFGGGYDVVWWVSADDPAGIPQRLAELAPGLGLRSGDDVGRTATAVLDALRLGRPYRRWLLVYDNAEDPESLAPWLPAGSLGGHVIVTSRNRNWAGHAGRAEIDVFAREESVRLLSRTAGVRSDEGQRIAELLGDLPLAVGQAAAWLRETPMPAATYLELLEETLTELLDRTGPGPDHYPHSTAATLRIAVQDLARANTPAARMLETCAFFGPDAIPARLLYSRPVIGTLGLPESARHDLLTIGELLRAVNRFGLARFDQAAGTIDVHRLVRAVLHDQVDEADGAVIRAAVHSALAADAPDDPDTPANWPRYAELLPHLWPSGAVDSPDPRVRRWIVDSVRAQWQRGLHASGRDLAERILERWRRDATAAGTEPTGKAVGDDAWILQLRTQLGNIQRSQGALLEAYETDLDVLERLRATVGPGHLHTLAVAGSLGGDLRLLGRYREARDLDERTLATARNTLGPEHPRTLMIANNLAISEFLAGDLPAALRRHRLAHQVQQEVLGARHPYTLSSAANYGCDLREAGRLQEALDVLEATVRSFRETIGDDHRETLRTRRHLGVTLRRLGRGREALRGDEDVHRRCLDLSGARHPDTAAAAVSLAGDVAALGDTDRAVRLCEDALAYYRDGFGELHPTTLAVTGNLAALLRRAGRTAEAGALSEGALEHLRPQLGDRHPYVLVTTANRANHLVAAGAGEAAAALEERAVPLLAEVLGADHHDTVAATSNLALSLAARGEGDRAARLTADSLRRARQTLGATHPITAAVEAGERLDFDIDPPWV